MSHPRRWQLFGANLLAGTLAASSGCLGAYLHPVAPPQPTLAGPCLTQPQPRRDQVYVYIVNGLDPLNKNNLPGLCNYVRQLGFEKARYGQLVEAPRFGEEIRRLYEKDPGARFVLIGYSFGANAVRSLANDLKDDGIAIDLLVYLGGDTVKNGRDSRPDNARSVLNITARGCVWLAGGMVWSGEDIDGAVNVRLDASHSDLPTHKRTLEALARHLAAVAAETPGESVSQRETESRRR